MRSTFFTALAAGAFAFGPSLVAGAGINPTHARVAAELDERAHFADFLSSIERRAAAPDSINVKVKNLYPEDTVFDTKRKLFYQSNLWKGRISVWGQDDGAKSHMNVDVPGVSSNGNGDQQMAGLSLDNRDKPKRLYGVCKNAGAFRFGPDQVKGGASSFHAFDLPLTKDSKPVWSATFDAVTKEFESKHGTLPFAPVASAQDKEGNSYVAFALGIPAIAKVSPDGKKVEAWAAEKSNGSERPGYTGIAYSPSTNHLVALAGPRPLTAFDLSSDNPSKPIPVKIDGDFGSLDGAEKIHYVPSIDGKEDLLLASKKPNVYSFRSNDKWHSASFKQFSRDEFQSNELTTITDAAYDGGLQIYGAGAYFDSSAHSGRRDFPLYKIDDDLLS